MIDFVPEKDITRPRFLSVCRFYSPPPVCSLQKVPLFLFSTTFLIFMLYVLRKRWVIMSHNFSRRSLSTILIHHYNLKWFSTYLSMITRTFNLSLSLIHI